MSRPAPEKGDWVRVIAMVVDPDPHPDEFKVRLESHNEHYLALVRRDHCEASPAPPDTPRCPSLYQVEVAAEADFTLVRCTKLLEHSGKHRRGQLFWGRDLEYGNVEL